MSCTNKITPIFSKDNLTDNSSSSSQSYNDLINYCSIRKQLIRIIPQYMNYPNQKFISNRNFTSDIKEFHKLKQEIKSMKESISLLKEKKQKKLEQIEELRCLMRKVGNKQNNNNYLNFPINNNYSNREIKTHNNKDQGFRVDRKCDKKNSNDNNIKCTSDDIEGGLSGLHTTSGMSSGKDDDSAPKGGDYEDNEGAQSDFLSNNSNSSSSNCSNNNHEGWRCCFIVEADNGGSLILEKDN